MSEERQLEDGTWVEAEPIKYQVSFWGNILGWIISKIFKNSFGR